MPQTSSNNATAAAGAVSIANPSPMKPRGSKSHLNGIHQAGGIRGGGNQNGHSSTMKENGNGVDVLPDSSATTANGGTTSAQSLETQMASLSVSEI